MGSNLFNLLSAIFIAVLAVVGPALIAYGVIHWIIANKSERSQQIVLGTVAIVLALASMFASTLALVPSIQSGLNQLFATSTPSGLPVSTPTDELQSSQTPTLPAPTMTVNSPSQPIDTLQTATLELSPTPVRFIEKGVSFVQVPEGPFVFEGVEVNGSFLIGEFEVTKSQFVSFLNSQSPGNDCSGSTDCVNKDPDLSHILRRDSSWIVIDGYDNHPVTWVSWYAANDFCKWLGGRLPTKAEWAKAAGWNPVTMQSSTYPWGEEQPSAEKANYSSSGTVVVGSFPKGISPIGAYDMVGNVWEYTVDEQGSNRFWRGGGWNSPANIIGRFSEQSGSATLSANDNLGFRCVKYIQ